MQTGAPSDFPLLIKSLLRTPLQIAPDAEIVSDGLMRYSYRHFEARVRRFAAGLAAQGSSRGRWSLSWTGTRTAILRHFSQCR